MAMHKVKGTFFSKEFNIKKSVLSSLGVFDPLLDIDSNFFINIKRLEQTEVPEFNNAYFKINSYFTDIATLLDAAKEANKKDKFYFCAIRKFNFPEVNGINLGFSDSEVGNGFGGILSERTIKDAYDIIKAGCKHPEIFHLVSLFEDRVGPDRLSDMFARLVYANIIQYNKRIYSSLEINKKTYPSYIFDENGIPFNKHKKGHPILLLPVDILQKLPIAREWEDIDRVCVENASIRNEINELIAGDWERWEKISTADKKAYIKEHIFEKPQKIENIIKNYRSDKVDKVNLTAENGYLLQFILSELPINTGSTISSIDATKYLISNFKNFVENNKGYELLLDKKEFFFQKLFHCYALEYCYLNNLTISPETNSGRGPVDILISRGTNKTVIETKLSSNPNCVHGYTTQIEEYAKAENTQNKFFVLGDNGINSGIIASIKRQEAIMKTRNESLTQICIIEIKPKKSASKY